MSELLANISSDIRTDGRLDNPVLGSQLMNNAVYLDVNQVISNMKKKYSGLGISVNVSSSELKEYIDQFIQNCEFEQTLFITYPATGKYGLNILADDFVNAISYENGRPKTYSLKAELPAGNSSLKIVVRGASYYSGTAENWIFESVYPLHTYTAFESGKPADAQVSCGDGAYITIEYYENGAMTPTKVKKVKID